MSGEAPEGEGKTCPGCGGLGWIPAGDEQLGCIDCNGTGHAPAPPSTAPGGKGKDSTGVREAFVAGAAWYEFYAAGATIGTSDRRVAEAEAERRYPTSEWIESPRLTAAEGRVAELEFLLRECNAVCLCGCPDADHEADECGPRALDEIVAEGRRLETYVQTAVDMRMPTLADEAIENLHTFFVEHGARLLAAVRAAMEMRDDLAKYGGPLLRAIAAFDAAGEVSR